MKFGNFEFIPNLPKVTSRGVAKIAIPIAGIGAGAALANKVMYDNSPEGKAERIQQIALDNQLAAAVQAQQEQAMANKIRLNQLARASKPEEELRQEDLNRRVITAGIGQLVNDRMANMDQANAIIANILR